MNVLILSTNTGQGHNSCAQALEETFKKHGDRCEIKDVLAYVSPKVSDLVGKCHVKIYRHAAWSNKAGYEFSEKHPVVFNKNSPVYAIFMKGARKLAAYIDEQGFDAVLTCHVFGGIILTQAKEICSTGFKTASVSTDYTCSPGIAQSSLDHYFIPHGSLKDEFISAGVDPESIHAAGLPVRGDFFRSADKNRAKKALGINADQRHLIVMCGSMGGGPVYELTEEIAKIPGENVQVSVICGTNGNLKKKIEKKFAENKNLHAYGYVGNMSAFMDSADLFLTKPGGISVTEAAVKGLPMVFVNSVSGCEDHNFKYFIGSGGALSAKKHKDIAALCMQLIHDDAKLSSMSAALKRSVPDAAAETIYRTLSV